MNLWGPRLILIRGSTENAIDTSYKTIKYTDKRKNPPNVIHLNLQIMKF